MSEKYVINGGRRLEGKVNVQGSKNATLPLIACAVNCKGKYTFTNIPLISDVYTILDIFSDYGVRYEINDKVLKIDSTEVHIKQANYLMQKLRASSYLIGALLPDFKELELYYPGGCKIGARPLDIHFSIVKELGGEVVEETEKYYLKLNDPKSNSIKFRYKSVGATINGIMLCSKIDGQSTLINVAEEPEVDTVIDFYNKTGVKVWRNKDEIRIIGNEKRKEIDYPIPFDRIVAGDVLLSAVATKGEIELNGVDVQQEKALILKLSQSSCQIRCFGDTIYIRNSGSLSQKISTAPYPGFPTDLQAQFAVACVASGGEAVVLESVFGQRFNYAQELKKFGASVIVKENTLWAKPNVLVGTSVNTYDLRSGMALVIAGLAAKGVTEIGNLFYLDRGYEDLTGLVRTLNGEIKRIE